MSQNIRDYILVLLSRTKKYYASISDFKYDNTSLQELLENEINSQNNLNIDKINPKLVIEVVANAMVDYLHGYPASYPFKKHTADQFKAWLMRISKELQYDNYAYIEEFFEEYQEADSMCAMIKLLHNREGMARSELESQLGISEREVHKNLRKLCPELSEQQNASDISGYRLGGMPVNVKVDTIKKKGDTKKYYRTTNTMHPIVLMENVMQSYTLLSALAKSYENGNNISLSIGVDIWYQLSEYGQERMRYLAQREPDVRNFIYELEEMIPNQKCVTFMNEQNMFQEYDGMGIREVLMATSKVFGRECDLCLKMGDEYLRLEREQIEYLEEEDAYRARKSNIIFHEKQVDYCRLSV